MKAHLTDEEWLDYVHHDANEIVLAHLQFCGECRQEAERLQGTLARFADLAKIEAAAAQARQHKRPVTATRTMPHGTWAWALAAGLILAAGAVLTTRRPPVPVPIASTNAPATPQLTQAYNASAPEPATPVAARREPASSAEHVSDDALLKEIQSDTSLQMPQALQPVALIVAQRNQFAKQLADVSEGENE